jgi:diguanylate cyclase (GGDEF)-like protein/PAS domain S-box-containing protein
MGSDPGPGNKYHNGSWLAQQNLAQERFLSTVINAIPFPFLVLNLDHSVALANESTMKVCGGAGEGELFCYQLTHHRDTPCSESDHPCPLREVARTGKPVVVEHQHMDKNGDAVYVEVHGVPVFDDNGKLSHMIEMALDITAKRLAEQAIAYEKERLAVTLASIGDGVIVVDTSERVVLLNAVAEALTGWSQEEAVERPVNEVFRIHNEKTLRPVESPITRVFKEGRIVGLANHTALVAKDGTVRSIADSASPIRNTGGTITGVIMVFRDVTREREREAALEASEALFRLLAENATDVIYRFRLKPDQGFEYVSPAAKTVTGHEPGDYYRDPSVWKALLPEAITCPENLGKMDFGGAIVMSCQQEHGTRWMEQHLHPIYDSQGHLVAVEGIARDVTERKMMEEELSLKHQQLVSIFDSIDEIVYVVDPDTYEILYANQAARAAMGGVASQVCYRALQQGDSPCSFCTNHIIFGEKLGQPHVWEFHNSLNGRWYRCIDRAIPWPTGKMVRYEMAIDISDRKKAEMNLAFRYKFENLIAGISTGLISLPAERIDEYITRALERIGEFLEVDRAYVLLFSEAGTRMDSAYEWCREGIPSQREELRGTFVDSLPWFCQRIMSNETIVVPMVEDMPGEARIEKERWMSQGIHSIIVVPMVCGGTLTGFAGLEWIRAPNPWLSENSGLLRVVGELISNTLQRKRAEESVRHLTFHDAVTGLYNRAHFEEEMQRLQESGEYPVTLVSTDIDGLKLVNDTMGHLKGDEMLRTLADLLKKCFRDTDVIARLGGDEFAVILPRTTEMIAETLCARLEEACRSYSEAHPELPISISLGMATAYNPSAPLEEIFNLADRNMYRDKMHRTTSASHGLVKALRAVLATRVYASEGHLERVSDLCSRVGQSLSLPMRIMSNLALLAEVHDLGKIGVRDQNLFHKDHLTEDEMEEIRQHPVIGYRIARDSPELSHIADLILHHHEWWDGSGYPEGLSGRSIPMECRILAVVDAYEAMISGRPYRPAVTPEEAIQELEDKAGSQFDPAIVQCLVEIISGQW